MGTIVKFSKDSHFQRIRAHFLDDSFKLSKKEDEMLEIIRYIFSLRLKNKFSKTQAIKKCIDDYGVNQSTAYRYYSMSMAMFGELDEVDVRGERLLLREEYNFLYQQLLKDRNWTEAKKVLDSLKDMLPVEDSNKVDPNKLQASEYHIKVPKNALLIIHKKLAEGVVDFNNIEAEDIEYEEVKNDE